ncbi:S8 family serine peptidase [Campylobacter fetus]|uniref:Serine protease, subtilase family n=2 Tax=Campylobacter fetus TaxID=196 RepID=A0RRR8_CAMFF|nr:S8 family serine peptidase [Campylobacter fetus]ABK82952.1 serine protease, subtilase family [Campylobacter fetus subsp. fetus 82-40]EAI3886571.1 autotransporter domain-containing protein [Campylobacter fetus]EAI3915888.1 autotransporter domain-containing protein [Campylobacter fetus]EAI3919286.1 autotransporter domain-containing protein [Campylobacter fetus]EAI8858769.1 autotransporter domain-containing protein [Campylobacter fetus]
MKKSDKMVIIALCTFLNSYIFALEPNFEKDLDIINTKSAYEQGITGQDVFIGIFDDDFRLEHSSLNDQILEALTFSDQTKANYWNYNSHGSQVAAIALGAFNNPIMHGVAYNAKGYGMQAPASLDAFNHIKENLDAEYKFFGDPNKNIKIINNSFGDFVFPILHIDATEDFYELTQDEVEDYIIEAMDQTNANSSIIRLSKEKQILNIFAAGNSGISSPSTLASLPHYDQDLNAWLAVGAIDSSKVTKLGDEGFDMSKPFAFTDFSNAFKGTAYFSILTPGEYIWSADSATTNGFVPEQGTSMAAPFATGAAALVSQKFPFLNGKQIGDLLLSTANSNIKLPKMVLKNITNNKSKKLFVSLIYVDNAIPTMADGSLDWTQINKDRIEAGYTDEEIAKFYTQYFKKYSIKTTDKQIQKYIAEQIDFISDINNIQVSSITKEELIGQGILDIKKAMNGLALLDANRLTLNDILNYGNEQALYYTIDTNGYNATFANDIAQRKYNPLWHYKGGEYSMHDLNVGFIKDGGGILTLSADAFFEGNTIVRNGGLKLFRIGNKGGEIKNSNVFVEQAGTLSGNGIIQKNLYNQGIVRPGNEDLSDLIVNGTYTQNGENASLQIDVANLAKNNSKLIANNYDIKNSKLVFIPLTDTFYEKNTKIKLDLGNLKNHLNSFSTIGLEKSLTLDFDISQDKESIVFKGVKNGAYDIKNSGIGASLRDIRYKLNDPNLNRQNLYKDFFKNLDTSKDISSIQNTVKSIDNQSYLSNISALIEDQAKITQNYTIFAINNNLSNTLFAPNNDYAKNKEYFWYAAPNYKKTDADEYKGRKIGTDFGFGTSMSDNGQISLNLGASNTKNKFNESNYETDSINAGINYIYDFQNFKVLSAAALGYGKNTLDLSSNPILSSSSKSNYNHFIAGAMMGLAKDFEFNNIILTPISYVNYNYIYQEGFDINSNIFARKVDSISHHTTSINAGLNLAYLNKNQNITTKLSSYAIYEYRLSGKDIKNSSKFIDFSSNGFTQKYELSEHLLTIGANLEMLYPNDVFIRFSTAANIQQDAKSLNLTATIGKMF